MENNTAVAYINNLGRGEGVGLGGGGSVKSDLCETTVKM